MSAAPAPNAIKWKRTGWFVPSEGKFLWSGHYSEGAAMAYLSLTPGPITKAPNSAWWFKLYQKYGPNPGGRLTKFKSDNGFPVYYDTGDKELFIYNGTANKVRSFNGAPKVRKLFDAASNNANKFVNLPTYYTSSGMEVKVKNGKGYYAIQGKKYDVPNNSILYKKTYVVNGQFKGGEKVGTFANIFKGGAPAPPAAPANKPATPQNGYTKTSYYTQTGNSIYTKNATAYYKLSGAGNWILLGPDAKLWNKSGTGKKSKGKVANLFQAPSPVKTKTPAGITKISIKSLNGLNVYSNGKYAYVQKNGKWTKQFKGMAQAKAHLKTLLTSPKYSPVSAAPKTPPAPVAVLATSTVPVIPPVAQHTLVPAKNARIAKLGLLLKAIIKKKKALKPTKNININNYTNGYCGNKNKGIGYIDRTNRLTFTFPTCAGMGGASGHWQDNLATPKFKNHSDGLAISYNQFFFASQLRFEYFPTMNNFSDFKISNMIDMDWYQKQNKFVRTLGPREVFLMFGYSHNGDVWAHAYLDGRFNMKTFKEGVAKLGVGTYFALFFQAREFYKINTGDVGNDYKETLKRVKAETDVKNITAIIQMFIDELNTLVQRAPATTKPFTVFRGVKDDTYMSGIKDKQYTLNRFASTSISGMKSYNNFSGKHTLQRIMIMPGSKCLCMFGFTAHPGEWEILLPRGSTYIVRNTKKDVTPNSKYITAGKFCSTNAAVAGTATVKNLVDIILLGVAKKFVTKKKQVPVVVPVAKSPNVQKLQKILSGKGLSDIKVLNKLGQGGFGAVFKGVNSMTRKNVAIKVQKYGPNSVTEARALQNLIGSGVTPVLTNVNSAPWSQNAANLIPKGLTQQNKASIMVMNLAKGKPLRNFMTGPPISQALKNKIVNAVGKVSARGWIHGNLHRNNIIVNNKGNPILIDFGKAVKGPFKTTNIANKWLKGLGKGHVEKYGKKFWYTNNAKTKSHYSNKNFLDKIQ